MRRPELVKQLERFQTRRADGRQHTQYRDLYQCPVCGGHYEALRSVVMRGYKNTCGQCVVPVAPKQPKRSLDVLYPDSHRSAPPVKQYSAVLDLPVGVA